MDIGSIILQTRQDILDDDSQEPLWDDPFMLAAATRAEHQACSRRNLIFDDATPTEPIGTPPVDVPVARIPIVPGQQTYNLNRKWTQIEDIVVNGTVLTKRSKEEMEVKNGRRWMTDDGIVSEYVQRLYTIYLVAIPTTALTGLSIQVEGYRLPLLSLTDMDQEPEIPPEFHDDLKWWIAYEAYNKRDSETYNPNRALECLANFERVFGPPVPAGVRMNQFNEPRISRPRQINYLPSKRSHWMRDDDRNW